jgi:glycine/D-amino acid oxidase-like deaminating enzyme
MHPLSPRGKLVHWGLEGLLATNRLVEAARAAVTHKYDKGNDTIVLRNELYRIAETDEHVRQLQQTAILLPTMTKWRNADEIRSLAGCTATLGGLELYNGCRVLHVPSYLQGLWEACRLLATKTSSSVTWNTVSDTTVSADYGTIRDYDATILCGGAGMFAAEGNRKGTSMAMGRDRDQSFPVQLVRGQSLELQLKKPLLAPVLCGKYISPMATDPYRALVGATHEFQSQPMSKSDVLVELQRRTATISSFDWTSDVAVDRVTMGYRVQSVRGKYGRRPIIGRLPTTDQGGSSWIFTALGSRGLLYHSLYGEMLADAILVNNEHALTKKCSDMLWWKT